MLLSGAESFDFRAKKFGNQPQDFLSICFSLRRQSGGRHPDKKPPVWAQTLNFLAQKSNWDPEISRVKIKKKHFRQRGGSRGRQPPRGVTHPFLSKRHDIHLRNVFFGGWEFRFPGQEIWKSAPRFLINKFLMKKASCIRNGVSPTSRLRFTSGALLRDRMPFEIYGQRIGLPQTNHLFAKET